MAIPWNSFSVYLILFVVLFSSFFLRQFQCTKLKDLQPTPEVLRAFRDWLEKTCDVYPKTPICQKGHFTDQDVLKFFRDAQDLERLCQQPWTTCAEHDTLLRINAPYINNEPRKGPDLPNLFLRYCPASLKFVNISHNVYQGKFPAHFHSCRGLHTLDLSYNQFNGPIPPQIERLTKLQTLDLSHNQLEGEIPHWINSLDKLRYLYLSHNKFTGNVPSELGQLKDLRVLDLSSNQLTGRVPDIPVFRKLNLMRAFANNSGLCGWIQPPCPEDVKNVPPPKPPVPKESVPKPPVVQHRPAPKPSADQPKPLVDPKTRHDPVSSVEKPPDSDYDAAEPALDSPVNVTSQPSGIAMSMATKKSKSPARVILIIVGIVVVVVVLPLLYIFRLCCRRPDLFPAFLRGNEYKFTVAMLKAATMDFDEENHIGMDTRYDVYRGILVDDRQVAVKVVRKELRQEIRTSFVDDCKMLLRVEHENIVRVLGWCGKKKCLAVVMELMGNGSLETWLLDPNNPPSWSQRLRIALQVGNAVSYLHKNWPNVHCNVKSSNILLDEDFSAYISDFEIQNSDGSCNGFSAMVYSYGVLLLELLINRRPVKYFLPRLRKGFPASAYAMIDPVMQKRAKNRAQALQLMDVALACTAGSPEQRPGMNQILGMLQRVKNLTWVVHEIKRPLKRRGEHAEPSRAARHKMQKSTVMESMNAKTMKKTKKDSRAPSKPSSAHRSGKSKKVKPLNKFNTGDHGF
eukprot:Gb_21911 [translate_table: standard]